MIHIEDNLYIDADRHEYRLVLQQGTIVNKKTGKEEQAVKVIGHFSSLESAILAIPDMQMKEYVANNEVSLHEAVSAFSAAVNNLTYTLKRGVLKDE